MAFRVLSHTADTGIEAEAGSFPELVAELGNGMFALMASVTPLDEDRSLETTVESGTSLELMIDSLAELLYLSEVEDLVLYEIDVTAITPNRVRIRATGTPIAASEPTGPPVKAVTYHDAVVEKTGKGWYGRVYFDV